MLDEFYFPASTDTLFLHLPLPASAQTNATRFRLWQPYNSGERTFSSGCTFKFKRSVWVTSLVCVFATFASFHPKFVTVSSMLCPSGKKEEVWVIDDLIIDGSSLHNPPVVMDSFEEGPNESNWLFFPGGNTGLYCPYQKTGL